MKENTENHDGLLSGFGKFFSIESSSGIVLFTVTALAMIIANTSLNGMYEHFFLTPLFLKSHHEILTVRDWINEGFMAVFFLSVGLEIRREFNGGELSTRAKASFPIIAAIGGMVMPALIFFYFNAGEHTSKAWGIPVATDIAFSLGLIALLGKRIPSGVRIFVAALAIGDDIGAILVIAFFYATNIEAVFLLLVLGSVLLLFSLRWTRSIPVFLYYIFGAALWYFLLRAGVHPSISGAALAFLLPESSLSENAKNRLQRITAFFIMPLFAFANAGFIIEFSQLQSLFTDSLSMGIFFGLVGGKTIGIFSFSFIAAKFRIASLPEGLSWKHIFGAAMLCGIGFTMSLFIAGLAFTPANEAYSDARFAIIAASCIAGIAGYCFLRFAGMGSSRS